MPDNITEIRLAKSVTVVFLTSCIRWFLSCARIVLVAFLFGATFNYDAYLVAFTVPEMITDLLVGIIAVTFIPIFTEYLLKESETKAWEFASNLINIIFAISLLLVIIMVLFAPFIIRIVAPGFNPHTFQLSVRLIVIIIPIVLVVSLAELITRILHSYQRFAIAASSRVLEVAAILMCLVFLSKKYGIFSLAYGLLLGAVVRLIFQLPILWEKFKYYRLSCNWQSTGIKKIKQLAGPLIFCMLFLRIGTAIERLLASTLKEGSISILGYATSLTDVPSEIFVYSLGVVLFPLLSQYASENKIADFKAVLSKGIRIGNFILIPIAVFFIFFGKLIIKSLLERGQFIGSMTNDTSIALSVYALGLFVIAVYFFTSHACYALQEARSIIKIAIFVMVINITLKLILINYLSFAGLALATSVALMIHSGLLVRFVRRKIGSLDGKRIAFSFLKILGISILMASICWLVMRFVPPDSHKLIQLAVLVVSAGISYVILSFVFRIEELVTVKDLLKKTIFSNS